MKSAQLTLFRLGGLVTFFICALLLGYAYWLEHVQFLDPCPLCIFQRVAFVLIGAVSLIAAIHNPKPVGRTAYAVTIALGGLSGAAIAARHIYLQHLPPDQVPECGPGLEYMLAHMPWSDALAKILSGSGECAEVSWSFLTLSMPWWTLFWFVSLSALMVAASRLRS